MKNRERYATRSAQVALRMKAAWLIVLFSAIWTPVARAQFAGGDGSAETPYQVADADQLNAVSHHLDKHFIQIADIDLDVAPYNEGSGWQPIGNDANRFQGRFDGNGYTIVNLMINRSGADNVGLFGYAQNAVFENVHLEDVVVAGRQQVGALVGRLDGGSSEARRSSASGTVTAEVGGGGLVGRNEGTISESRAAVAVKATFSHDAYAGGLAGYSRGAIRDSYAIGSVTSSGRYTGGLVGRNHSGGQVQNCYAIGPVSGNGIDEGGLVGNNDEATVAASFWDMDASSQTNSAGGIGMTTAEMKSFATFYHAGWDFIEETVNGANDIWGIDETGADNDGYPFLAWQNLNHRVATPVLVTVRVADIADDMAVGHGSIVSLGFGGPASAHGFVWSTTENPTVDDHEGISDEGPTDATGPFASTLTNLAPVTTYYLRAYAENPNGVGYGQQVKFSSGFAGGTGTAADPFRIETPAQLNHVRDWLDDPDIHFRQIADIDLEPYLSEGGAGFAQWGTAGWLPIGDADNLFRGRFDGNNHAILHLDIWRPETDNIGLFGYAIGALIENVHLIDADVRGNTQVGALVGRLGTGGEIHRCSATGRAAASTSVAGGLIGRNIGTVRQSYADVLIDLFGSEGHAGGLVAWSNGDIYDSYAVGPVANNGPYTGGLVGRVGDGLIVNCYSIGAVSGTSTNEGGFAGTGGDFTACFWDTQTSGQAHSWDAVGKTTAEMKTYSTFFDAGWDFLDETVNGEDGIWGIDETGADNDGYPFLAWQNLNHRASPTVITLGVEEAVGDTAIAHGEIHSLGFGGEASAHGFVWLRMGEGTPTLDDNEGSTDEGPTTAAGHFSTTLTNLASGAIYWLRAYAVNPLGTNYGERIMLFTGFAGGDGTQESPYQVATPDQLYAVRYHLDRHFIQIADIDLDVAPYNKGRGWRPIGQARYPDNRPFTGRYNGNGHTISNLFINMFAEDEYNGPWSIHGDGLFHRIAEGAKVEDVHIRNVDIRHENGSGVGSLAGFVSVGGTVLNCSAEGEQVSGLWGVGGLVGWNSGLISHSRADVSCKNYSRTSRVGGLVGGNWGTIRDSHATGPVILASALELYSVGGLVGENQGTIERCFASGTVSADGYRIGGLVGWNREHVRESFATGAVSGNTTIGGLAGENSGSVRNGYATGAVSGDSFVGGLVGYHTGGSIRNSYATGAVSGNDPVGGLVGRRYDEVTASFYDSETTGQSDTGKGEPRTTAEMKIHRMYWEAGWDFVDETRNGHDDFWSMDEMGEDHDGYPSLTWQGLRHRVHPIVYSERAGGVSDLSGTTATAYADLYALGHPDGATQYGYIWGLAPDLTLEEHDGIHYAGAATEPGSHPATMTNLTPGAIYYIRAFAVNAVGVSYGSVRRMIRFAGGDGSEADPYRIALPLQLDGLRDWVALDALSDWMDNPHLEALHFKQVNDLDLTDYLAEGGYGFEQWGAAGWEPIGTEIWPYGGRLDGGGHTISNLVINRPDESFVGLIATMAYNVSLLTNLHLVNADVQGYEIVGSLVGDGREIVGCSADGVVQGVSLVGGLVGFGSGFGSMIRESTANVAVSGNRSVGGLMGRGSTITDSHAFGAVTGVVYDHPQYGPLNSSRIGGLAGVIIRQVERSSASGAVSGGGRVGGLIGEMGGDAIRDSFATGTVSATQDLVGGLVGTVDRTSRIDIERAHATGDVSGRDYVGGLIGEIHETVNTMTVSNSSATGAVTGRDYAGGLIGTFPTWGWRSIDKSYATGAVTGRDYVGGLIGSGMRLTDVYATGAVSGERYVGGLAGLVGHITRAYASGAVSGTSRVGGLVGEGYFDIEDSFYDAQTSGQSDTGKGEPRSTDEMKAYPTFHAAGWDFVGETGNGTNDVWGLDGTGEDNQGYPFLAWQGLNHRPAPAVVFSRLSDANNTSATAHADLVFLGHEDGVSQHGFVWSAAPGPTIATHDGMSQEGATLETGPFSSSVTGLTHGIVCYLRAYAVNSNGVAYSQDYAFMPGFADGLGTEERPFQIETALHLDNARGYRDARFVQIADIDLAAYLAEGGEGFAQWGAAGWLPIGSGEAEPFSGHYDGAGHTVSNLAIDRPEADFVALFGYASEDALIENVHIVNAHVTGSYCVGTLLGRNRPGTVRACSATGGSVAAHFANGGGLVGWNSGSILDSQAHVPVTGPWYIGGLTGYNYGDMENCHAGGDITGTGDEFVGGLVGRTQGTIADSSATGNVVSAGSYVGGLVGSYLRKDEGDSYILDSHATGDVTAPDGDYVGGLVGASKNGDLADCTAAGNVLGRLKYVGGLIGELDGGTLLRSSASGTVMQTEEDGYSAGGLIGFQRNGIVEDCAATGDVTGYSGVGGLVGETYSGVILASFASGDVTGVSEDPHAADVGGLIGLSYVGTVSNAFAQGRVESPGGHVGGLIGYSDFSVLTDVYATGPVAGQTAVGGLIGSLDRGSLQRGYAIGTVNGTAPLGGLIADVVGAGTVSNAFWNIETSGLETSAAGTGLTIAAMKQASSFTNWVFDAAPWTIIEHTTYPWLSGVTPESDRDRAPPIFPEDRPAADAITDETLDLLVTLDEPGTAFYAVLDAGAASPGPAQIRAGTDADDQPLPDNRRGQIVLESGIEQSATVTGLTIDTAYDIHVVAEDDAGNLQPQALAAKVETATSDIVHFSLAYRAGAGGTVDGEPLRVLRVAPGASGPVVTADPDSGAVFHRWSDGSTDPTRTDTDVQADIDVTAGFRSAGGADLDWYAARGIGPDEGEGETWFDVDNRPVSGKGTTLREENIADTDPNDPTDRFEILAIHPGSPVTVAFRPGSAERVYRLLVREDLVDGEWTTVPGTVRPGQGEGPDRQDTLADENAPIGAAFYRIEVEMPE